MPSDREIAEAVEGLGIFENRWIMINEWGLLPQEADFLIRFRPDRVVALLDVVEEAKKFSVVMDQTHRKLVRGIPLARMIEAVARLDALDRSSE